MSKAHRGSELRREVPRSGRGTCPVTHKSGVKLLFDYDIDGTTTKISKYGKAILENRRLRKEKEAQRKARAAAEQSSPSNDSESNSAVATVIAPDNTTTAPAPEKASSTPDSKQDGD